MDNYGNDRWVEHNKKEFGVQIIALKKIIEEQVRAGTKSDGFTSDMLVAMQSGRKITPKMEDAINNIIKRNTPEELYKRDDWLATVLPKLIMVKEQIKYTDWTDGYNADSVSFMGSIIKQAKSRKTLSEKQMLAVSKLYVRIKKNIKKNENKS
tara:strand:- start:637 stop:1095 length:459 start_codon:yes stop_codon:yes gene_type:complete